MFVECELKRYWGDTSLHRCEKGGGGGKHRAKRLSYEGWILIARILIASQNYLLNQY